MFRLLEDKKYIEKIDTQDEPLWGHDSPCVQLNKRLTSYIHKALNDESRKYPGPAPSPRGSNCSAFASRCWKHHTASMFAEVIRLLGMWHVAAAIKKSNNEPPAFPAPQMASHVTRGLCQALSEVLMASIEDRFPYAQVMEIPPHDHWKRAMEEDSTSIMRNNTFSTRISQEAH